MINEGNASYEDICNMIQFVQKKVQNQFNITLEPEVKKFI